MNMKPDQESSKHIAPDDLADAMRRNTRPAAGLELPDIDYHTPLSTPLEWRISPAPVPYDAAVAEMQARAADIRAGTAAELIWLLEHAPVYTAGTSARKEDLLAPGDALIRETGRGGEWTYHGPGQRVVYILLDVSARGHDLRRFVHQIEAWSIAALAELEITATRREGFPGVWVDRQDGMAPDKITAIGIRLSKWVSWHGMAINRAPDLERFAGIVPCGIHDGGVTSIKALGKDTSPGRLDQALENTFNTIFGADNNGG